MIRITAAFFAICIAVSNGQNRVRVDVYYETLCPDSIDFILDQLVPTYEKIGNIMDVTMVPFGFGTVKKLADGSYKFTCQHGPDECRGNLIQTCALYNNPIEKALPFIACMEEAEAPQKAGPACAKQTGLNYKVIDTCVKGKQGNVQQNENAVKTQKVKELNFIPWIGINGDVSRGIQKNALYNFLKVVCDAYTGAKPSACNA